MNIFLLHNNNYKLMKIKIKFKEERYLIWLDKQTLVSEVIEKMRDVLDIEQQLELVLVYQEYQIPPKSSSKVLQEEKIYDLYSIGENPFYSSQIVQSQSKNDNITSKEKVKITKRSKSNKQDNQKAQKEGRLPEHRLTTHNVQKQPRKEQKRQPRIFKQNILRTLERSPSQSLSEQKDQERKVNVARYYNTMKDIRERIRSYEKEVKATSIEDFVGGQVDYYYSPRNYTKDNFIKNSSDSQGWMNVDILLLFPKIGKLMLDAATLKRYLRMYQPKYYQLNQSGSEIRRKQQQL